jgi:class 3 adenylate cyclase
LALDAPVVRGTAFFLNERSRALLSLAAADWELYLHCSALTNFGWTDIGRRVAERHVKEAKRGVWRRASEQMGKQDLTDVLPKIECPTLVLQRRGHEGLSATRVPDDQVAEVAMAIPNARTAHFRPDHAMLIAGSWDSCLQVIEEFFDGADETEPRGSDEIPSGTAIILFADIVDSTALTERLGDAAFREKARDLDGALRGVIRERGGRAIEGKLLGDGVLAVFTSAREAIEAALACGAAGADAGLPLHLGLHAGDVIREENNVYGGAVNIAARISGLSAPGEVLVSDIVRGLARTSAGVRFEDHGEQELKGVGEPVRVWAVREASDG